jgi:hypothetical protein
MKDTFNQMGIYGKIKMPKRIQATPVAAVIQYENLAREVLIRFNPLVSSWRKPLLETKEDGMKMTHTFFSHIHYCLPTSSCSESIGHGSPAPVSKSVSVIFLSC